jgi:hypothetical protein
MVALVTGFWPPCTTPLSAAPAIGSVSVPLRNWLVEHPVTIAETQQSNAATEALLEIIPKIRFVIRCSRGLGKWIEKAMVRPIGLEIACGRILHPPR